MSSISGHSREQLNKLCKQLDRGEDILTKEVLRLKSSRMSNQKSQEARNELVKKHEGTIGRMMFVRKEIEELLEDLPPIQRKKRTRRRSPPIRP